MAARLSWFFVVAVAVSYVSYLIAGSIVSAQSSQKHAPIIIRDELEPGIHHLSGMVMVPSACDELSVRTERLSTTTYRLLFRTWHEPSVNCSKEETPRYFRVILFAPSTGVAFTATLDGAALPIFVIPARSGHEPFTL